MQVEVRRVGVGLAGQLEQTPFFVSPNPYYCYRPLLILPETRQDKHESRERTSSQNPKIWLNSTHSYIILAICASEIAY